MYFGGAVNRMSCIPGIGLGLEATVVNKTNEIP